MTTKAPPSSSTCPGSTLSRFSPGSLREVWSLTWPLMLSYVSLGIMLFTDRVFLAQLDATTLNASARASMAYLLVSVIPVTVASISEVVVGKLNGAGERHKIGGVFWASWLWSILLVMPSILVSFGLSDWIFSNPSSLEAQYFKPLALFLPFQALNVALGGLYIGTGHVRVITYGTILGALTNVFFDWALIFGNAGFEARGASGAAIGTGLGQVAQGLALVPLALMSKKYYIPYQTHDLKKHLSSLWNLVREFWSTGFPVACGQWFEMLGHNVFFYLISLMGEEEMMLTVMAQSFYLLLIFVGMSMNKTIAAISANAIGAGIPHVVNKALLNCFILISMAFVTILSLTLFFNLQIAESFLSQKDFLQLENSHLLKSHSFWTLVACCFFFYFDSLMWTMQGLLTARMDTKIILWTSLTIHWAIVVIPLSLLVYNGFQSAYLGWVLLTLATMTGTVVLFFRHLFRPIK